MSQKSNLGICAFCGTEGEIQKDHIPPKILYPKPRPTSLLTVPSCVDCHKHTGKEDTYLRDVLSIRDDVSRHVMGEKIAEDFVKDVQRKERIKTLLNIDRSVKNVDVYTLAGIYIDTNPVLPINAQRLENEIKRIVKGLHFHLHKSPLPSTYSMEVIADVFHHPVFREMQTHGLFTSAPLFRVGDVRVFSFKVCVKENSLEAVWFLQFYETVDYLVRVSEKPLEREVQKAKTGFIGGSPFGVLKW